MQKKIKIFGERNTGTNYLEILCKNNLECHTIDGNLPKYIRNIAKLFSKFDITYGDYKVDELIRDIMFMRIMLNKKDWKHRMLSNCQSDLVNIPETHCYILAIRHPLPWLLSMYRRPYSLGLDTKNMSFSDFLKAECKTVRRECTRNGFYKNPMMLWNKKVQSYKEFSEVRDSIIVKHEDIVLFPEEIIKSISSAFNIKKNLEFKQHYKSTKPEGKNIERLRNEIVNKLWEKEYSMSEVSCVRNNISKELLTELDYSF